MKNQTADGTLWRRRFVGSTLWSLVVVASFVARASEPGSLDLTFDPTAGGQLVGLTGGSPIVHTVQTQPDGKILIGGSFRGVNGALRNNIARLHADGSVDVTFQPGWGADGEVTGLAVQPDGKVILIGSFRAVDAQPRSLIARLNADGSVDETFNCHLTGDVNLRLDGLAVQPSGKIWIGGRFTNVNGVDRLNLARLHADGSPDTSFDPHVILPGTHIAIHRIRIQADSKVLVSGTWLDPQRSLIRLNADGTLDEGFRSVVAQPTGYYEYIYDMFSHTDGTIAIVGTFESLNGVVRRYAARLAANGGLDTSFSADFGRWATAAGSVVVQPDGKFVVGGWFSEVSGSQRLGLARLNTDGSLDESFDSTNVIARPPGTAYQPNVQALALQTDGRLVVGAYIWWLEENRNAVFRVDPQGRPDPSFSTLLQSSPIVGDMVLQPDGKVIVGTFDSTGYGWPSLVRLNTNGLVDESFQPDTNLLWVSVLTVQPDGKILANYGYEQGPLRLHPDGSVDTAFQPPPILGYDQVIETIVVQPDGKILVGGLLVEVDGKAYRGITRLHPDGRLDPTFVPVPLSVGDDAGGGVEHILLLADGKILIAGGFMWEDGSPAGYALLDADGTLDGDFLANSPGPGYIGAAALQSDGKILMSGAFIESDGRYRDEFLRLNANGTLDPTFQPAVPKEFSTLTVQPDGRILAVRSWEKNGIFRFHPDGSLDPTFQGPPELSLVEHLILQRDGQVLVSGGFQSVDGIPMTGIARLNNDVSWRLQVAEPTQPGEFRFMISGRSGARLIIEASPDLTFWTPLSEVVIGTAPVFFTDSAAPQFEKRFYRAHEAR